MNGTLTSIGVGISVLFFSFRSNYQDRSTKNNHENS
jgi:hypothetical protein